MFTVESLDDNHIIHRTVQVCVLFWIYLIFPTIFSPSALSHEVVHMYVVTCTHVIACVCAWVCACVCVSQAEIMTMMTVAGRRGPEELNGDG